MAIAKVEDVSAVKKKLFVTLTKEEVQQEYKDILNEYAKRVKIKGFRPGKAPLNIVEMHYSRHVLEDTRDRLIQKSFEDAIKEKGLNIIGIPNIKRPELRKGEEYSYVVEMEVRPQFELPPYKGIELKKRPVVVTDEMVDKRLKELQLQYATLKDVEEKRPIAEDDKVVIKCSVVEVGGEKKDDEERIVTIDLTDSRVETVWRDELIGKNTGDKGFIKIQFPEDHPMAELKNKEAVVSYEILGIKTLDLPELNDEFAKKVSSSFTSLSELTERVRQLLIESEKRRAEDELIQQAIRKIVDPLDIEVPSSLVAEEVNRYLESVTNQIQASGGDIRSIPVKELIDEYMPKAERKVKERLVLADIAKKEGIEVDREDILSTLRTQAAHLGQSAEALLEYYNSRGMLGELRNTVLSNKTLMYIIENAKIQEEDAHEPITTKETQNGGQI